MDEFLGKKVVATPMPESEGQWSMTPLPSQIPAALLVTPEELEKMHRTLSAGLNDGTIRSELQYDSSGRAIGVSFVSNPLQARSGGNGNEAH